MAICSKAVRRSNPPNKTELAPSFIERSPASFQGDHAAVFERLDSGLQDLLSSQSVGARTIDFVRRRSHADLLQEAVDAVAKGIFKTAETIEQGVSINSLFQVPGRIESHLAIH